MAKSKSRSPRRSAPKPKATRPSGQGDVFERIADALERLSPQRKTLPDLSAADAFVWHPDGRLAPVPRVNRVEMSLLEESTGSAMFSLKIPSVSRKAYRPITLSYGERAAWVSPHW